MVRARMAGTVLKAISSALCSLVTAAPFPTATPVASPTGSATPGFVGHRGTQLSLDGSPWRFTGANAYELATLWGVNAGCGDMVSDGHWKDAAWYNGGYRRAFDDDGKGIAPASYWSYLHEIAARYRTSTTVAMWEL